VLAAKVRIALVQGGNGQPQQQQQPQQQSMEPADVSRV